MTKKEAFETVYSVLQQCLKAGFYADFQSVNTIQEALRELMPPQAQMGVDGKHPVKFIPASRPESAEDPLAHPTEGMFEKTFPESFVK